MPILNVHIAGRGTKLANGETSATGHMWYSIESGGEESSFGFAPVIHGTVDGLGKVYNDDTSNYLNPMYRQSVYITQREFDLLYQFGRHPTNFGFIKYYNGIENSCIDFTYKALSLISDEVGDYEGEVLPASNIGDKLKAIVREIKVRGATDDIFDPVNKLTSGDLAKNLLSCFSAGTPILMAGGRYRPIEDVVVGDLVLAFDATERAGRGAMRACRVTRTFPGTTDEWYVLRHERIKGGDVLVTPGHHFLGADGRFYTIEQIVSQGLPIVDREGQEFRPRAEKIKADAELHIGSDLRNVGHTTFNFEVEGLHTYVAGDIRVHNKSVTQYLPDGAELISVAGKDGYARDMVYVRKDGVVVHVDGENDGHGNTIKVKETRTYDAATPDGDGASIRQNITYDENGKELTRSVDRIEFADKTFENVADSLGSAIGGILGGDDFMARILASTAMGTILKNVAQFIQNGFKLSGSLIEGGACANESLRYG